MKRGLLLWIYVLAFALILSFFISSFNKQGNKPLASPTDCDANQVILSLFSSTNSHVSAYNDAAFPYKVCYSDIFGKEYGGRADTIHSCQELTEEPVTGVVFANPADGLVPIYRVYAYGFGISGPTDKFLSETEIGPILNAHYYTTDETDYNTFKGYGWMDEGIEGYIYDPAKPQPAGTDKLYRFYFATRGDFLLTIDENAEGAPGATEKTLLGYILHYDGSAPATGQLKLYRFFRPLEGDHLYTSDESERQVVINANKITGVYSTDLKNSHGFALDIATNPTDNFICYGDLTCVTRDLSCSGDEKEILRLSSDTNAHAAAPGTTAYTKVVCCKSIFATPGGTDVNIQDAYWGNSKGERFSAELLSEGNFYINDTVYLYAQTDATSGNIVLDIMEKDLVSDDNIGLGLSAPIGADGIAKFAWKITDEDAEKARDLLEGDFEFYFEAKATTSLRSSELIVKDLQRPFEQVSASIKGPRHRGIYYVNVPIIFEENSTTSAGNPAYVNWSSSDSSLANREDQHTFSHAFTTTGQKIITLTAKTPTDSSEDRASILVIGSPGINTYINIPFYKQQIIDNQMRKNYSIVKFNGSDSYAVNSVSDTATPCATTVNCLFGNCPAQTEQSPACSTNTGTKLSVGGAPVSGTGDFTGAKFNWTADEENLEYAGLGVDYSYGGFVLRNQGTKKILLNLSFMFGSTNLNSKYEQIFGLNSRCSEDGARFYGIGQNGKLLIKLDAATSTTENKTACAGVDGFVGTSDDCCPDNQHCTSNGCVQNEVVPVERGCGYYKNSEDCVLDNGGKLEEAKSVSNLKCSGTSIRTFANGCSQTTRFICQCEWDDAGRGACVLGSKNVISNSCPGGDPPGTRWGGTCEERFESSWEPIDGVCSVNRITECDSTLGDCDSSCVPGDELGTVPCGDREVELPFFDFAEFLGAIASIVLIYAVIMNRKRIVTFLNRAA